MKAYPEAGPRHGDRPGPDLGLSTAALAAEGRSSRQPRPRREQTIAVQLDGQNLTFTDAVPQGEGPAHLPALPAGVFEAMGAEVS